MKLVRWFLASSKQPVPALASFVRLGGLGAVPRFLRFLARSLGKASIFKVMGLDYEDFSLS